MPRMPTCQLRIIHNLRKGTKKIPQKQILGNFLIKFNYSMQNRTYILKKCLLRQIVIDIVADET
jgi:hypothetical protein